MTTCRGWEGGGGLEEKEEEERREPGEEMTLSHTRGGHDRSHLRPPVGGATNEARLIHTMVFFLFYDRRLDLGPCLWLLLRAAAAASVPVLRKAVRG